MGTLALLAITLKCTKEVYLLVFLLENKKKEVVVRRVSPIGSCTAGLGALQPQAEQAVIGEFQQ